MCIGRAPYDLRSVYILDWGLCRRYVNERNEVHRPRERVGFRGTPWYASMTAMVSHTDALLIYIFDILASSSMPIKGEWTTCGLGSTVSSN